MATCDNHDEKELAAQRLRMVDKQIAARGVRDAAVLSAMRTVPRHLFIPADQIKDAYKDGPLSIGCDQTISQPYVVASMTEHLSLRSSSRVLEIGTGSGYQTAVLAEIAKAVYTVEIIPELHERANELIRRLGYESIVSHKLGDGSSGWPEQAPFDGIMVTAAAPRMPQALVDQLAMNGRMVLPLAAGSPYYQELYLIHKTDKGLAKEHLYGVRFVPMQGAIDK